jgi:hypothetical protein
MMERKATQRKAAHAIPDASHRIGALPDALHACPAISSRASA